MEIRELRNYRLHKEGNFKIAIQNEFKNINKIYPLQQRKVREILDEIENKPYVKKVIVFGSSTSYRCHMGSDLDIYFELDIDKKPIHKAYDFEIDYWDNYSVDNRLLSEIVNKGVIVYER